MKRTIFTNLDIVLLTVLETNYAGGTRYFRCRHKRPTTEFVSRELLSTVRLTNNHLHVKQSNKQDVIQYNKQDKKNEKMNKIKHAYFYKLCNKSVKKLLRLMGTLLRVDEQVPLNSSSRNSVLRHKYHLVMAYGMFVFLHLTLARLTLS